MSAIPEEFARRTRELAEEVTRPFPNSTRIYVTGTRADVRVPMREIRQSPTKALTGDLENPAITVYDTSGPYTDPSVAIDLRAGLAAVREPWIAERGDTQPLDGPTSKYGQARAGDPALSKLRFEHIRKPRVAKAGMNVSQMHYARKGIVTPEMEFVAIRETRRLDALRESYAQAGY